MCINYISNTAQPQLPVFALTDAVLRQNIPNYLDKLADPLHPDYLDLYTQWHNIFISQLDKQFYDKRKSSTLPLRELFLLFLNKSIEEHYTYEVTNPDLIVQQRY